MSDVRTALLATLRNPDDASKKKALESALGEVDLATARQAALEDPSSPEGWAKVIGRLVLDDADDVAMLDAAKAAAQRAPRDANGNDVALLAGEVVWHAGGQPKIAEPYFRRVRRSDAANPQVLDFYRTLFEAESAASQLMQVLVQARRAEKDAERRFGLAEEMSDVAQNRLRSADRAIEVWRSVLREDPSDVRPASHLERLYREAGKWTALVELLKERYDQIEASEANAADRIEKLAEIASLYRRELKLDTMALATLQRILEIDPAHRASLEALAETYAANKRHNDLLRVYGQLLDTAKAEEDADQQVGILRKIAAIWVEQLGNPQRALEPLAQVLALAPGDREARGLMARIHEQRRDWRSLIALRREELAERTGEEALALRVDLARLAEEKLGDRSEAIQDWNAVLEHHGEVDVALDALSRLYQREGRWAEAAEIIHRQVSRADSVGRAVKLLTEVGQIYTERLRSSSDAIRVWKEIARLVPGHDKAMRMLREAYVEQAMWDDLTELYVGQNRVSQLVDVLQSAADRVSDIDGRVALYRRVARLCREQLGQPERAVKALERTLAIQPDNLEVARELLPIYREQSNWARLLGTLEVLLGATRDESESLALIEQMRLVASESLQSPTLTLKWAAQAYQLRPDSEELRLQLEQAAEAADGWDELTRIFEARIEGGSEGEADERLLLLEKLAVIARDRLFKPDDAQRYFRRIIELDPSNAQAMSALESIYSHTRRWDDLSEVYRRRLDVTEDHAARLETLRGLARLQEEHLANLEAAVETYRSILELEPEDVTSLDALARILRGRGDWEPLAQVLERKLELGSGKRIDVLFELSQIRATRLHDSTKAVEGFLAILADEPVHEPTVNALEELRQADPSMGLPIMEGLLPYYRRVENRPKEAEAMEVLLAAEEDPDARMDKLGQLAGIYEKMPDRKADAQRIQAELFEANPGSWETRQVLQRLGRELGNMDEVATGYERVLAGLAQRVAAAENEGRSVDRTETAQRRDLLSELAAIFRDDLGRPADAERAYAEILERDETHQAAYEAMEALLRKREAWPELLLLYRRRADVVFNQREQRDLLSRIIEIARAVLGDRDRAQATAEELLDLIPDDLATIELLAGMYRQSDTPADREKLEELLGRWGELVEDRQERYRLSCQRAELRMQYLGDAYGAVDLLGAVLGEDPDHARARSLLEQLLDISEVQLQVAGLLEPIYQRVGDHDGRIRILRVRRAHAESGGSIDEATSYLLEIARIEEHERGNLPTAFEAAREAYLTDPRRLDTLQEVERLGTTLGRENELVGVWQGALADEKVTDKTLRIDLTQRMAHLLDDRLKDSHGARVAYVQLLELDPPDFDLAHRTVAALCRLHLEAGDFIALVETQQALLRFVDSHTDRVQIRLDIAGNQLLHLNDRVGAALTWSEVVDMEPGNQTALDALEALFHEEEEWNRLCEVLEHRISVSSEARVQAHLWKQIGLYRRERLGELQPALNAFQSVLDLKVGREESVHALQQLVEINQELERWPDVDEGLRRLTSLADKDTDRVRLLAETADVVGKRLGRGTDALELLKRVLDLSPTDSRARSLVSGYLEEDTTRERAVRILTPLYEAEQNWASLLELQELQARKQPSGRRRLQALLKVAVTHEEKLQDPERAFAVLCEAMTEAGDQPELAEILDKVERLGSQPERSEALFAAQSRTVDHILDSDLQQRVLRWMGEVALDRLGRLDDARKAYEKVLDHAPHDAVAIGALEQIYLRQGEHQALADLLIRKAEQAEGSLRDDLLIQAAEINRTQLDLAEKSIELYERLSPEGLEREAVQEVLEPLYEETGRFRELGAHLNRRLGRLAGAERVDTHLRLGRLYGEQLEDPEEGIRHLATALRLDPNHAVGTDELSRYLEDPSMRKRAAAMLEPVFTTVQDWPRLLQIQEVKLQEAEDEEIRVRIMLRMAQLQEEQLEDLEGAFEGYARVFKEQPGNRYVMDQLSRLGGVLGKSELYAELLTRHVDNADADADADADELLAVITEAADLWGRGLKKWPRAVPLYQRILESRPEDRDTFAKLEHALTEAGMWAELAEAYWREADNSLEEERQVELLMRLSSVAQDALDRPEDAASAFQRILEVRPEHEIARARLEQVFQRSQRWDDLLELLRDRMSRTEDLHVRGGVLFQIAELQNGPLDDPDGAIDSLEALLSEQPRDQHGVGMLERMAEARVEQRPRIFGVLQPVYEAANNTQRLVAVVEWRLTVTEDPAGRQALYRDLARLLETLPDGTQYAFRAMARAVAEPGPAETLSELDEQLDRYASVLQMPEALAEALVVGARSEALATDVDRRLQLLVKAAKLQIKGAPEVAVEVLNQALELQDDHETALELMDDALARLGYHEDLSKILERRVKVVADEGVQVELLRRMATLLEDVLGNQAQGEASWRRLLEIEPSDPEALRRLSRTYEASGSTAKLIEVLERRIDASVEAEDRRGLRMQLASIHREAAKDRGAEIDVLRSLLSEAPSDDDALAALARALLAEERHAEAADVMQDRATLAESAERKAALMLEAARVYANPLGDLVGAVERYEQVLQLVEGHDAALGDLVELTATPEVSESTAALVRPHLEVLGRWESMATVLANRAKLAQGTDEQAAALRELASIRHDRMNDIEGALEATLSLIDKSEAETMGDALQAAMRLASEIDKLAAHIEDMASRSRDDARSPEVRIALAMSAADAAADLQGDREKALQILVPLLDSDLAPPRVCERIEDLARAIGQTELVARALDEAAGHAVGNDNHATVLIRLGEARLSLGELDAATEAFRDALDVRPNEHSAVTGLEQVLEAKLSRSEAPSPNLLDALETAYLAAANRTGLARITQVRLSSSEGSDRLSLLQTLATQLEDGGGAPEDALAAWGQVLTVDPESTQALDRVEALAKEGDEIARTAGQVLLAAVGAAHAAGGAPAALSLSACRLWLRKLGDPSQAAEALRALLSQQPEHPEGLLLAVETARAMGDAAALHEALTRAAAAQVNPDEAAALWREAAAVADSALGDATMALADLRQLIDVDENDAAAWQKLLAHLGNAGQHDELAEALAKRAMITPDDSERRDLRYRLANLYVDKLDRVEDAIMVYNDMLGAGPDDVSAMRELEVLLRRAERWADVRELLERKLDVVDDDARIEVLEQTARLAEEKLDDMADAIEVHQRIATERPSHQGAQTALRRLLKKEERWEDLATLLESQMEQRRTSADMDGYRDMASRLAELLADKLENTDRAQEILQGLLEVDPEYVPAIVSLASVYEARGEDGAMRLTLQRAAELNPQGAAGAMLQMRLAKLAGDAETTRGHLESALQLDPANVEAGAALLEQSREEERWDQVAYLLEMAVGRADNDETRRALQIERVDIMVEKLEDLDGALRVLAGIYERVQDDIEVNRRIANALFQAGRLDEAQGMYQWLVEVAGQTTGRRNKAQAVFLTRLARIELSQGEEEQASSRLEEAYRIDTTNVETQMTLGALHEQGGRWQDALKIYRSMLLQNADKSGLLRRGDIYLRLSATHMGLEEKPKAQAMLRRGIEEDPEHPQLREALEAIN